MDITTTLKTHQLFKAIENGDEDLAISLIENGANLRTQTDYGLTSLSLAIDKNLERLSLYIIDKDKSLINIPDNFQNYPLHYASKRNLNITKYLVEHGADLEICDIIGLTPILLATSNNQNDIVEYLAKQGANINKTDPVGSTPFSTASKNGNLKIVKILLENGADFKKCNDFDRSPFSYALDGQYFEIAELLLSLDKNLFDEKINNRSLLHTYSLNMQENESQILFLINKGAKLNLVFNKNNSLLHKAVLQKKLNIMQAIIDHDFYVDTQNENGQTPLHLAIKNNFENGIKLLLDNKADISITDKNGKSPLDLAYESSNSKLIELLVNHYNDNTYGFNILLEATYTDDYKLTKKLLKCNLNINAQDFKGYTPLMYAITNDNVKMVMLLVDNGADINLCNKSGETPLDIAKKYGRQTIETYLIQKGAKYIKFNKHDFIEK